MPSQSEPSAADTIVTTGPLVSSRARQPGPPGDGDATSAYPEVPAAPVGDAPVAAPTGDGPGAAEVPLKGWSWLTAGMLALVAGVLWTAQGLDVIEDSLLSGQAALTVAGQVVAVAGLALIVVGVRVRARFKRELTAADQAAA
ncbi:hypothetical protein [Actinoplanes sp. RD1]|uniref:hypothetical protein n=1 Tax=Actinoplanes sp. RD1 TaxID=3064538 RepID=UPI00274100F2|nr:hypothetical protein [Actinoplanes sp. RD1]